MNCTFEVVFSSGGCSLEVPFQCARLTLGLYEAASFWLDVPTVGLYLVCKAGLSRLLPFILDSLEVFGSPLWHAPV